VIAQFKGTLGFGIMVGSVLPITFLGVPFFIYCLGSAFHPFISSSIAENFLNTRNGRLSKNQKLT